MMKGFGVTLAIVLGLLAAGLATPAAALNGDEAVALCRKRGDDCKSMKITAGDLVTVIICVNNSSTGNGVQCVQCPKGEDCSVVRRVAGTTRGGLVGGILTNKAEKR